VKDLEVPILVIGKQAYGDSVISEALKRKGYPLKVTPDPQEALKLVEEEPCSLVLFNIGEPKMADLEIVAKLRVRHSFEDLPIVVVTDRADRNLIVRMLEIGANDYILRPLSTSISLGRIENQLRTRQAIQALQRDREKMRDTLNSIPDFICRVSPEGTILEMTAGVHGRLFQVSPSMVDKNIADVVPKEVGDLITAFLNKNLEIGSLEVHRSPVVSTADEVFAEMRLVSCHGRQAVCIVRDVTEQQKVELELQELAKTDTLTQIANRRHFDELFAREWLRQARANRPMALLVVDIDYFKRYNDKLGHPQGDLCLVRVARGIQEGIFRPGDFVTRYGGEEFAVILTETDLDGALLVAERIREAVENLQIEHPASLVSRWITASVGVSATVPTRHGDPAILLQAADQALYEAKSAGRNCIAGRDPDEPLQVASNSSFR
jgi:diguanylate cyclase (GGDEF)-like protein